MLIRLEGLAISYFKYPFDHNEYHALIKIFWTIPTKGGLFSERAIRFSNLQNKNIPNYYPELEI